MHAKAVQYRSNGTGRDSYIVATSGGFNNPACKFRQSEQAFNAGLRHYDRPNSAYTKIGGMSGGLRRTASTNTFAH